MLWSTGPNYQVNNYNSLVVIIHTVGCIYPACLLSLSLRFIFCDIKHSLLVKGNSVSLTKSLLLLFNKYCAWIFSFDVGEHMFPQAFESPIHYLLCWVCYFIDCKENGCFSKRAGFKTLGSVFAGPQKHFYEAFFCQYK